MIKYILLVPLTLASLVLAQPMGGMGDGNMRPMQELNLEPRQQKQIMALRTAFQSQAIDLRADLQKLELTLGNQMRADKPDTRAINGTVERLTAKQGALRKLRVHQQLDVRALLTPEQRQIFDHRLMGHHRGADHRAHRRQQRGWRW